MGRHRTALVHSKYLPGSQFIFKSVSGSGEFILQLKIYYM